MTLDELIVVWFKKGLEVAGSPEALNQCVDLANGYIRDVLKLPIIEWTDAKDFPSKAGDKYEYIKSTPTNFPSYGDIVIWNGNIGGGHGHIAVALGGDANTFVSVDENWSISQRVTIERHNYDNVDGWLHPKVNTLDTIAVSKTDFENLVKKSSYYDTFVTAGYSSVKDVQDKLDNLKLNLDVTSNALQQAQKSEQQLRDQLSALQNQPPPTGDSTTLKSLIRPFVNNGWIAYLRARSAIQLIVNV